MPVVIKVPPVVHAHAWEFQFARRVELVVLSWLCRECSRTKITQLLPRAELTSTISISLGCYLELLAEGRRFDERYENLHQADWLLANWSIDDQHAYFILPK